jgi:ribosomal protein S18 acetylase RimI-like enzyme
MNVILARDYHGDTGMKISEIFVEGFYQWLKYFSKDKAKLKKAFAHMFNPEVFYIAVIGDKVAGITACNDGAVPSVILNHREFRRHLGFFMGTIAYYLLRQEFEKKQYPFEITKGMGLIEFVATSDQYRGQGVATTIISHIINITPYKEYALEVADTNTNAVKLYEKLGFTDFMKVKDKHSKQSGINYFVYMKIVK